MRGSVVLDPGFARIYTYARSSDDEIPKLEEGQELALDGEPWSIGKETQPPSRISQGKLIELMEERGLGTKATRADIIQKLYDRGYVYSNPPEPSETGIAMYRAFKEHVPRMATPEMTAELEFDMDQIANGDITKDEVLRISREMLHGTTHDMQERSEDLAKVIWAGMDEDKFLGPCKVCEEAGRKHEDGSPNRLRVIDMRGGKRFWGCEGYNRDDPEHPDSCRNSGPLPGRGYELWRLEETLLGLRAGAAAHGEGLPRPPLEALPERRLPDDGRDAREARGAPGAEGSPRGREGRGERRRGRRRRRRAGCAEAEVEGQRRPPPPQTPLTGNSPHEEGGLARAFEELAPAQRIPRAAR